jgi:hypothetical protein
MSNSVNSVGGNGPQKISDNIRLGDTYIGDKIDHLASLTGLDITR